MHLSLDEVEGVSSIKSDHSKEAVLGLGTLQTPVKGDLPLSPGIADNIGTFPSEDWFVEVGELTPQLPVVISHSEAVRHGAESVLEILEVTVELRRIVSVGDDP